MSAATVKLLLVACQVFAYQDIGLIFDNLDMEEMSA
jgi:hypothetical protein